MARRSNHPSRLGRHTRGFECDFPMRHRFHFLRVHLYLLLDPVPGSDLDPGKVRIPFLGPPLADATIKEL
jgi:hypothetical protein